MKSRCVCRSQLTSWAMAIYSFLAMMFSCVFVQGQPYSPGATNLNVAEAVTNWGSACEGLRLGISFPKDIYTNGEPIVGVVAVQNVTNVVRVVIPNVPCWQELIVINAQHEKLEIKEALRPKSAFEERLRKMVNDPKEWPIDAGMDFKLDVRVDSTYDLQLPGTYEVSYWMKTPNQFQQHGYFDLYSGRALLHITP
jgi:hypothetical protein